MARDKRWIAVEDSLPGVGVPVLVYVQHVYGDPFMTRRLRAQYAGKHTLEQAVDCEGGEYDEATDTFFCAEGWYETNEFEATHWAIDGTVTHWMPLPGAPVAEGTATT